MAAIRLLISPSLSSVDESAFVYCKRRVMVMQATSLPVGCVRLQADVK